MTYMKYFDELGYVKFFQNTKYIFNGYEYLYYNLMYLVRMFGGNYICFEFIIYSAIIISYIYIIDKEIQDTNATSFVILFFIPLLQSLNIIRNCFVAAIGFIAMEKMKQDKCIYAIILMIVAYLSHYVALILVVFAIFYKYFPDKFINKKNAIIIPVVSTVISIISFPVVIYLIKHSGFANYANRIQISLWGYIPTLILYGMMFLDDKFVSYVKEKGHYIFYKGFFFLIALLPITISINVAYRLMLFFDLPKYILYSDLYLYYREKNIVKNKKVFDIIIFVALVLWLIFRIYRMWSGASIMPYRNILFERI